MKSTVPHSRFTHRFFFLTLKDKGGLNAIITLTRWFRVFHFCYYFFLLLPQWFNSCSGKNMIRKMPLQRSQVCAYYFKLITLTVRPQYSHPESSDHTPPYPKKNCFKKSIRHEKNFLLTSSTFGPRPSNILWASSAFFYR